MSIDDEPLSLFHDTAMEGVRGSRSREQSSPAIVALSITKSGLDAPGAAPKCVRRHRDLGAAIDPEPD